MSVKPNLSRDAFVGTADDYVRYRIPYPEALLRDLLARASTPPSGRLLDLACGPGRLTLPLAGHFREVWASDLEPEMIDAARRQAGLRGVSNVAWMVGRAEELEAPLSSFDLVTMGDAFHRLEQDRVCDLAMGWLKPGGCIAVLGSTGFTFWGRESWQRITAEVASRWVACSPPPLGEPAPGRDRGVEQGELKLREKGFAEVASHEFHVPHDWTVESITGHLFSTSFCSRRVLGDSAGAFSAELSAALLAHDPAGRYHEVLRFGYTLGHKPR